MFYCFRVEGYRIRSAVDIAGEVCSIVFTVISVVQGHCLSSFKQIETDSFIRNAFHQLMTQTNPCIRGSVSGVLEQFWLVSIYGVANDQSVTIASTMLDLQLLLTKEHRYCPLTGTHFPFHWGLEAEWLEWLFTYRNGIPANSRPSLY